MRKYDPHYTKEFRDEQLEWFRARMDKLPQELQINKAAHTSNLPYTVKALLRLLESNEPSVTFSGYMELLLQIRDKLEEGMS